MECYLKIPCIEDMTGSNVNGQRGEIQEKYPGGSNTSCYRITWSSGLEEHRNIKLYLWSFLPSPTNQHSFSKPNKASLDAPQNQQCVHTSVVALSQLSSDLSEKIYSGRIRMCYLARRCSSPLPSLPFFKPRKEFRQAEAEMQISTPEGLTDSQINSEFTLAYVVLFKVKIWAPF